MFFGIREETWHRVGWFALAIAFAVILVWLASIAASAAPPAAFAQVEPPTSSMLELWTAVLAILTTVLSSLILHFPEHWGPWAKRAAVAAIAGLLSVVGLFYQGKLDTADWSRTWLLVFLGATALYTLLWRPATDALKGQPKRSSPCAPLPGQWSAPRPAIGVRRRWPVDGAG